MAGGGAHGGGEAADPVVTRYVEQDKVAWYNKPNLRALYFLLLPTCMGVEMTSGFDSSMMNGLQGVTYWDNFFGKPRGNLLGIMSSMYSLGAICALPLVPIINDRLGRRAAIMFGSILMIIGAALQASSINYAMFVMSRWILGLGIPFAIVAASTLIGELSYPKERAVMTSLFNASWFVGAIIAAGVTFGTFDMKSNWSWRIPSLLQAVPSLLQISFVYFIPESPRWLISKGRRDDAFDILVKYHAEGDRESEFVKAEFAQIESTLKIEQENANRGWKELFATPGMRRRVIIASFLGLFTQWSGNGMISRISTSYYLKRILEGVGITNNRTVNEINLANTCWGFVNGTIFALSVYKFKRRPMYLACTISLLCVYVGWTTSAALYTTRGDKAASHAVLAMIFLYSPAYNLGYNALTYTFLVELFPFTVRSRGIAIFQWWGRAAGFFNQYVNPIGISNAGWKYYISYCVWLAFEIIFVFFMFPETSGRTLEELTFLFEPEEIKRRQQKNAEDVLHGGVPGQIFTPGSPISPSVDKENIHEIEQLENRRV
ncbi:MFS sugar transporter [Ceratobasidium theobromae]|uniref:MFS sugar transporter n=1 Tax=Ceratobasidium theobromae TaxID=1582974 RepID=A0A5N5QN30_9AGAM|nr:MFS sugar transporter [Ceratobasidium theobromae]